MRTFFAHWCSRIVLRKTLQGRGAVIELAADRDLPRFELGPERKAGIGHHGLAGIFEQRDIGRRIADVVESFLGEALFEAIEFVVSGQICSSVAGQDFLEDAEMFRDVLGKNGVGAGGEIQFAAFGVLFFQISSSLRL